MSTGNFQRLSLRSIRKISADDNLESFCILRQLGPEVIEHFPCSTQLSMKFIMFINVKMPTIVGILTFIGMINTA